SITPGGEIAVTDKSVYDSKSVSKLVDLPQSATVQAISSDYSRLIYYDSSSRTVKTLDLLQLVGPSILGQQLQPPNGAATLPPARLAWPSLPGIKRYQVYLGTSQQVVEAADTSSPSYLGETNTNFFVLPQSLVPGTTCFWRFDGVTDFDTIKGTVYSFTV